MADDCAIISPMESRWYQDPKLLRAAYEEYGSFDLIATEIGGADRTTLSRWWKRHGLGSLSFGPEPKTAVRKEALNRLAQKVYADNA